MAESFAGVLMRGIEYEGLRESINIEIAHHSELVEQFGQDTVEGRSHLEAITRLAGVRRLLAPNNAAAIEIAGLLLDNSRAERAGVTAA